jgi:hypothetical protein
MAPTIALHLNFSLEECSALGIAKDIESMSDEVSIAQRYSEVKGGKSRVCKLICSAAFNILHGMDTKTFDEISTEQWEQLAKEARDKAEAETLQVQYTWRNPDVADSGGGFKLNESQITFPMQLAGIPLSPLQQIRPDILWGLPKRHLPRSRRLRQWSTQMRSSVQKRAYLSHAAPRFSVQALQKAFSLQHSRTRG